MNAEAIDINFNAPVKSVSIENMLRIRDAAMARAAQLVQLYQQIRELTEAGKLGTPDIEVGRGSRFNSGSLGAPDALEVIRREIDRGAWDYLMAESGLRTFMDATARKQWDGQLHDGVPPELTADNIEATFRTMHARRGDMFDRGVIECFKQLSWNYKTNQPFKFGKKIILEWVLSSGSCQMRSKHVNFGKADKLDDLVRVFHVLDGKPEPDHRSGMYGALTRTIHEDRDTFEGEYFTIKLYGKGTGHITFKRPDLVDRLNNIIAKHYPGALPDATRWEAK